MLRVQVRVSNGWQYPSVVLSCDPGGSVGAGEPLCPEATTDGTCGAIAGTGGGAKAAQCRYKRRYRYRVSGLLAGLFVRELRCCPGYRHAVWRRHGGAPLLLTLLEPGPPLLDAAWARRLQYQLWERRELDYMMSWLSTLGGAFSALGDYYGHCAEIAGRISLKQLELALRLGDPLTVARCKLYAAISLLQRGSFETAAALVRQQFRLPEARRDRRLRNMCRGIWSKLRYERRRRGAAHG